jgi:hypothetical protein
MIFSCPLLLDCSLHFARLKGVPGTLFDETLQTPLTPAAVQAPFPEALAGKNGSLQFSWQGAFTQFT